MNHVCIHAHQADRRAGARVDPTRTQTIRARFERDAAARFRKIRRLIVETVAENDALALSVNQPAPEGAFDFPRSSDKVSAFMAWLRREQDREVLGIIPGTPVRRAAQQAWTNVYIEAAYRRGMQSAATELRRAGATVRDSWIDAAFFRPIHADRAGLIFTRAFTDLHGITEAMDQQISRVLAQGIIEGRHPRVIARQLADRVDKIGITRARTIARTEVIAAHAEATLNSYDEAGIEGVTVMAEFSTSQDDAVCPECEALEGREFSLDEAHGMIPVHPNCRCAWIPVVSDAAGVELA